MRLVLLAATCMGLVACFSPKYRSGDLQCSPHDAHPCPTGYYCASTNTCWQNGSSPTVGGDMSNGDLNGGDMGPPPLPPFPPAAVWISGGGGTVQQPNGPTIELTVSGEFAVGGSTTAASPSPSIQFGYFSSLTN